jgi:hypothetical protein
MRLAVHVAATLGAAAACTAAAAPEGDPCHARSGNPEPVPCLRVPSCADGSATIDGFKMNTAPGLVDALQNTTVRVCWNISGVSVRTNASDKNIFNTATRCQQAVFNTGDVLEVFVGPVETATDDPVYYHEIDTGSSGAMWQGQVQHGMGGPPAGSNVSNCGTETPPPCASNHLNCTGLAHYDRGLTAHVTIAEVLCKIIRLQIFENVLPTNSVLPLKTRFSHDRLHQIVAVVGSAP